MKNSTLRKVSNSPSLKTNFEISRLEITTPDKITLEGNFLKNQNPNARTLILFHGNCDFYQSGSGLWLMDLLNSNTDTPYNFILFNPRGIGNSDQETANEHNLQIDAESIYQTAVNKLNIPENQIDIYGHSIGGAQAANLKNLHPDTKGRLFLDRTFSSLDAMIKNIFERRSATIHRIIGSLVKTFGWEFNTQKTLTSIHDPVFIFTHDQDKMIPTECRLKKEKNNETEYVFHKTQLKKVLIMPL